MASLPKPCGIDNCEKLVLGRGWCAMHYGRWRKHGNPHTVHIPKQQHGLSKTRLYTLWANIRQRTSNPRYKQYKDYGGRGIKMCAGWWNSFPMFVEDIGERPSPAYSLDRADNDQGYYCGKCDECVELGRSLNVRWATRPQQQINQRRKKTNSVGYKGVRMQNRRYVARISYQNSTTHIGRYDTPEQAAEAYNLKALELYGEFAVLNILPVTQTK